MAENNRTPFGTDAENELAKKYDNLVKEKLKGKIERYLQTNNVNKYVILQRIAEIQDIYIEMFDIQYEISQISPKTTVLKYTEDGNVTETEVYAFAIDEQAKNWLNRLSSILNVLTIKASEFNEIDAKRRENKIFVLSVIISTLIGFFISWFFDIYNDIDLNNQTKEIKKNQDSITNKMRQDYILNFDILKTQHQHQSTIDSIYNNKIVTAIKKDYKSIESQNKLP